MTALDGSRRGRIALDPPACTSCMICARECPAWCIHIESHPETEPATTPRGRPRTVAVLDSFVIDAGLCISCGICIEVCPFDALTWAPEHDEPVTDAANLRHDREQLAQWWPTGGNTVEPSSR